MPHRTRHSPVSRATGQRGGGALTVALIGAVVLGLTAPRRAGAQQLICASHVLTVRDLVAARVRAARALKKHLPMAATVGEVCRNPMRARASFESVRAVDADGVTRWWDVLCTRDTGAWTCEAPQRQREFGFDATIAGKVRRVLVGLAPDYDADEGVARSAATLLIRALPQLGVIEWKDGCAPLPEDSAGAGQGTVAPDRFPSEDPIWATVERDAVVMLSYGNALLELRLGAADAAAGRPRVCWSWPIYVT